jgi:hypothetical protein
MVAGAEQGDANRPASFGKMPGHNETVAAIVTGATQHYYGTGRPTQFNLSRNGLASILHQHDGCRAGGHRQTIRFAHPSDIE